MRTYYQVCTTFKFMGSPRASLVSITLHSTDYYVSYLESSATSFLKQSRYFRSVAEANSYIDWLYKVRPSCTVPRPVLDSQQLLLFPEFAE